MVLIVQVLVLLSNILLSIWYIPKGSILFANYLAYVGQAAQPIVIVSSVGQGPSAGLEVKTANAINRHGATS